MSSAFIFMAQNAIPIWGLMLICLYKSHFKFLKIRYENSKLYVKRYVSHVVLLLFALPLLFVIWQHCKGMLISFMWQHYRIAENFFACKTIIISFSNFKRIIIENQRREAA